MALNEQKLDLRFNTGADESQEAGVTEAPITVLRDFEYRKERGLTKRRGWQPFGAYDAGLGAAAVLPGGVITKNALLLWGASAADAEASPRIQHLGRVSTRRFANIVDSGSLLDCDVAYCTDGRVCVVGTRYDGSAYSVLITVFNTDGVLLHREVVTAARRARVVAQGSGRFNVFYTNTALDEINCRSIIGDPSQGGTFATSSSLIANHATFKAYDVVAGASGNAYIVYNAATTGRMWVAKISAAVAVTASYDTTLTTMDHPSIVYHPTTGKVHIVFAARSTTDGYVLTVNGTPSATLAGPTAVVTGSRAVTRTAACPLLNATDNSFLGLWETEGSFLTHTYVQVTSESHGTVYGVDPLYNTGIQAAPFGLPCGQFDTTTGVDRAHICMRGRPIALGVSHDGDIFTAMLGSLNQGGGGALGGGTGLTYSPRSFGPVTPLVTDAAGTLGADACAGRIIAGAGSTRYAAIPYISDNAAGTEHLAILVLQLDTSPVAEPVVQLGNTLYTAGMCKFFDGQRLGEITPAWAPDVPGAVTAGAGLQPAAGDYAYVAYAVWVDAQGEEHRSPVSGTGQLSAHAGGSVTVTLRFNAPSLLDTVNNKQKWSIRLYRTAASGSVFYFISEAEVSAADATVTITDTTSDATLLSSITPHEIIYTQGGILDANAPPAFTAIAEHQGRLWGISAQDPRSLWPTKIKREAIAPEFHGALVQRVEKSTLPVALASLHDKLLVATSTDVLAIVGEGPDDTGVPSGASSWAQAEVVCPGVGATGPHAMLTTPLGVIMHSPSGFKLIGGDLNPADIGGALLDTAPGSASIRRSILVPDRQQAWFLLAGGNIVVFDYARAQLRWSLFTCQAATALTDITYYRGYVWLLGTVAGGGSKVWFLDPAGNLYDDDGVFVPASLTTGTIRPDGLLGEVRFRVVQAIGKWTTPSIANGLLATYTIQGGEPNTTETRTFTGTQLGILSPARARARLKNQRGHSLKVTLTQVSTGATSVQGFEPYGLVVEFGAHQRASKTPKTAAPGSP